MYRQGQIPQSVKGQRQTYERKRNIVLKKSTGPGDAGKIKTSITVDQQLWREFGSQLALEGIEKGQAINQLMAAFLGGSDSELQRAVAAAAPVPAINPKHQHLHDLLEHILCSGSKEARTAIAFLLENLSREVKDG